MGRLLSWVIGVARIFLLAAIAIAVWSPASAFVRGDIEWNQAVDSIFTDQVVGFLIIILVISLVASLLRSPLVRLVVSVGAAALVILLLNGTITLDQVTETVRSYDVTNEITGAAERCGLDVSVERVGDEVRSVLKDPEKDDRIVGYVESASQFDPSTCTAS